MKSNNRIKATRAGALAAAVAALLAFSAQAQDLNFDIPASDLKSALDAYINQTGQQIGAIDGDSGGSPWLMRLNCSMNCSRGCSLST